MRWPDSELLDRASSLGRVLVSQDEDLLAEAASRQSSGREFAGLIYVHQQAIGIGNFISDLVLIAETCELEDIANRVEFLPL